MDTIEKERNKNNEVFSQERSISRDLGEEVGQSKLRSTIGVFGDYEVDFNKEDDLSSEKKLFKLRKSSVDAQGKSLRDNEKRLHLILMSQPDVRGLDPSIGTNRFLTSLEAKSLMKTNGERFFTRKSFASPSFLTQEEKKQGPRKNLDQINQNISKLNTLLDRNDGDLNKSFSKIQSPKANQHFPETS